MKTFIIAIVLIGILTVGGYLLWQQSSNNNPQSPTPEVTTVPNPAATPAEKVIYKDLFYLESPQDGESIANPLLIKGEARGNWFFEGTFPVVLTNWDGLIIAEGYASADGEWMTEEFVPFSAEIVFEKPEYGERGSLILQKSNPSGLSERDDAFEITVFFE